MARDFTKDLANYLSLGSNQLGPLINGAAKVSIHVRVNFDSLETTNVTNDRMLVLLVDGGSTGIALATNDAGSGPKLRIQTRSVVGDTAQNVQGTTTLTTGSWLSLGALIDFAGDSVTPYYQGVSEGATGVTFGNSTYTHGTPTGPDTIGGAGAPPSATANQVDGRLAEIAVWNDDIGATGFALLGQGVSALSVRPDILVFYMRLLGDASPEPATISSVTGTITGSVPQAAHPSTYLLSGPSLFRGRNFPFFDDEEVNRFEFWPAVSEGVTEHERSVAIDAVGAISTSASFFTTLERSLSVTATADLSVSGVGFTVFERSTAIDAAASLGVSSEFFSVFDRSITSDAVGLVTVSGEFLSVLERSIAIDGASQVSTVGNRDLLRSASLSATGAATVAGESFSVLERQSALNGDGSIQVGNQKELFRAVGLSAAADVSVSGVVEGPGVATFERSASIDATGLIETSGNFFSILTRSFAIDAAGSITVSGLTVQERAASLNGAADVSISGGFFSVLERSSGVSATADITVSGLIVRERTATLNATGSVTVAAEFFSVIERSAAFSATSTISVSGGVALFDEYERSAALGGTATITISGGRYEWNVNRVFTVDSANRVFDVPESARVFTVTS